MVATVASATCGSSRRIARATVGDSVRVSATGTSSLTGEFPVSLFAGCENYSSIHVEGTGIHPSRRDIIDP
ncbi:hypothetical protein GCM10011381_04840 [Klenkia taihuensis]|nr:hypothetical protein GCM10011381_04840 [Klenkia taihuensis]